MHFKNVYLRSFRLFLFPLAIVYGGILSFRNWLYHKKIIGAVSFNLPIIGVGNLSVGGTGKSPMVDFLVGFLKNDYPLATLSRGYKRRTSGYVLANEQTTAIEIGDEPMQFHLSHPDIAVSVCEKRIEAIRKGDLNLRILQGGIPVQNSAFEIRLRKHAFEFGLTTGEGNKSSPEVMDFYRSFNSFTVKGYWNERWHQPIEKEEGKRIYSGMDDELAFAETYGLKPKGHPLIWTVPKALPDWLLKYPKEVRLQKMLDHAGDLVNRYKSRIHSWDLCNEFLWEPSLNHTEERVWPHLESIPEILTYLEPAIRHIRKQDPTAHLVLNEYGLEKDYRKEVSAKRQRERFLELIAEMKKRGCEPDAIGTQCHVAEPFTMKEIQTTLDELASSGLPVQVTEFWARSKNADSSDKDASPETNAYIRNAYTLAFGHPAVEHFTYWGGGMCYPKGELNSRGKSLHNLIGTVWKSQKKLETSAKGEFSARVFFGEYSLMKEGKEISTFTFLKDSVGKMVEIQL
jgi:GH35 family endo-1,4-beta-xylanase